MPQSVLNIFAEIKGITYKPLLCRQLQLFDLACLKVALSQYATFMLKINGDDRIAVSWWVSPKRTRSYPYARVYDSLGFNGKKVTIIPIIKDEGKEGDRDFLQWDTISLMSLLGVYVIISYYIDASCSLRLGNKNKITDQRFDLDLILNEIKNLLSYQSDALHWNLYQVDKVREIGKKALDSYVRISKNLGIKMHSLESAERRIDELYKNKQDFMRLSREQAAKAQRRESKTIQPKEYLTGTKGNLTIKNYLGGCYYFTCDEVEIHKRELYLIEGKHTKKGDLPSESDIKDGLLKMILLTNLVNVTINGISYSPLPILKLTSEAQIDIGKLKDVQREVLSKLNREAKTNRFGVIVNKSFYVVI